MVYCHIGFYVILRVFRIDDNRKTLAKKGAIPLLIKMLYSADIGVQREAAGALRNMCHMNS